MSLFSPVGYAQGQVWEPCDIFDSGVSDVTLPIRTEAFTHALLGGVNVLVCHERGPPRNLSRRVKDGLTA